MSEALTEKLVLVETLADALATDAQADAAGLEAITPQSRQTLTLMLLEAVRDVQRAVEEHE